MIASFFYDSTIKNTPADELYKFEESYVCYLIIKELIKQDESLDETYLQDYLKKEYDVNINYPRFVEFLDYYFDGKSRYRSGNKYKTFPDQIEEFYKTTDFSNELQSISNNSELFLIDKLNNYLPFNHFDVSDATKYIYAIIHSKHVFSKEEIIAKYFDLILLKDDYYIKVDRLRCEIDESYYSLPIGKIIDNKSIQELLFANNINVVSDLIDSSVETIMTLLSPDINNCINNLSSLNGNMKEDFLSRIDDLINSLRDKEKEIIGLRNGFEGEALTLESIGQKYGVTRERIRQLEKKVVTKAQTLFEDQSFQIFTMFSSLDNDNKYYYKLDQLINYVESIERLNYLKLILQNCSFEIKYDEHLDLVYNSSLFSLDDLCEEISDKYGNIITISDYEQLSTFDKKVVNLAYRLWRSRVWLKNGIYEKDMILGIVDEMFPDGYSLTSDESAKMVVDEFLRKYGFATSYDHALSIKGLIEREGYYLVDRGVYKNKLNCVKIPEELKNVIIDFIVKNGPVVHYHSIYDQYTKELNDIGINNMYYLKGTLDPLLPNDFITQRTYLSTSSNYVGSYETILQYARSFDGVFSIDDLRERFIGIADYTLYGAINYGEKYSLIWLNNKKYIYADKLLISDETKEELKEFITNIFDSLQSDVISSDKVYARLSLTNKELLERLRIVTDSFSMFSIIKYLFKNEYGYNRPLISIDKNSKATLTGMIFDYISGFTSFNDIDIKKYVSKMNIRRILSYLSFMENISDKYVQTNVGSMVRKDCFEISSLDLDSIDNLISLMLERFKTIDTREFNGYLMFPRLKYRWNKYLLVGIIRSYYSNKYVIENTDAFYDKTDFIIRRLS